MKSSLPLNTFHWQVVATCAIVAVEWALLEWIRASGLQPAHGQRSEFPLGEEKYLVMFFMALLCGYWLALLIYQVFTSRFQIKHCLLLMSYVAALAAVAGVISRQ